MKLKRTPDGSGHAPVISAMDTTGGMSAWRARVERFLAEDLAEDGARCPGCACGFHRTAASVRRSSPSTFMVGRGRQPGLGDIHTSYRTGSLSDSMAGQGRAYHVLARFSLWRRRRRSLLGAGARGWDSRIARCEWGHERRCERHDTPCCGLDWWNQGRRRLQWVRTCRQHHATKHHQRCKLAGNLKDVPGTKQCCNNVQAHKQSGNGRCQDPHRAGRALTAPQCALQLARSALDACKTQNFGLRGHCRTHAAHALQASAHK